MPSSSSLIAALILWLVSLPAHAEWCGNFSSCSKHFVASGVCTGLDQIPILEGPWEKEPIAIHGVTIGFMTSAAPTQHTYAYAGNSYVPDIMALQIGTGSSTIMYPAGKVFLLPATASNGAWHVDLHIYCVGGTTTFQAWLVIYYSPQPLKELQAILP